MERLNPAELERTSTHLRKAWRGYNRNQVQEFIQKAALEMSALRNDVDALNEVIERQKAELEGYKAQENTIKDALLLAQRTIEDTRAAAERDAETVIEDAKRKGAEIEQRTLDQMNELRWDLERLRLEKQKFVSAYRTMLEAQLRSLTEANGFAVIEGTVAEDAHA